MKWLRIFLGLGAFIMLLSSTWAAVPQLINLQSVLTSGGSPVRNQTISVEFKIYDVSAGGTALWTETQNVTTDNNGAFVTLLGSVTPIPDAVFSAPDRWLGIKISTDPEMTPRTRLASTGYAYRVNSVDGASGGSLTGNLSLLDDGSLKTRLYGQGYGQLLLHDLSGDAVVDLSAGTSNGGKIALTQEDGTAGVLLEGGTTTLGSSLTMRNGPGNATFTLDADHTTTGGDVGAFLSMTDGTYQTVHLDANGVSGGAQFSLMENGGNTTISLDAESGTDGGAVMVLSDGSSNTSAANRVIIDANQGDGAAFFAMYDGTTQIVHLDAKGLYGGAQLSLLEDGGNTTISLDATAGVNGGGAISLMDDAGTAQLILASNWGLSGFSRVVTDVLQINGGADLSEQFDVEASKRKPEPGVVVCIDPENPGKLVVSAAAYDHKVAGIISGAGGVQPGMLMGQPGSEADGEHPVALTGRVYCWVDASNGPIEPGDLLTTSDTPGHAMRVSDHRKAQGAIIGKAMTSLREGKGLVLVLVSLQ
ncbi:MAG: hypothetical protein ACRECJ_06235 [Limisphaerales bacterium]